MTAAQKIRKCAESYFAVIRETVQENRNEYVHDTRKTAKTQTFSPCTLFIHTGGFPEEFFGLHPDRQTAPPCRRFSHL